MSSWPSLEIHVPISPTPRFLNMVRCLHASLRENGGPYRDAPIVLTVGDHAIDQALETNHPWLRAANIEIRWIPPALYHKHIYYATALERFRYDYQSDVVLQLDADVLVARHFADLVKKVNDGGVFAGLIAHIPPFDDPVCWNVLLERSGIASVRRWHVHTGYGSMFHDSARRLCPPYFNLGVLCAPKILMQRVGAVLHEQMECVNSVIETPYRCQIALTLAIERLAIPYRTLRMRFNFPNDPRIEAAYPHECADVRLIHLLRKNELNKSKLYESMESVRATVDRRDLVGMNERARQVLEAFVPTLERTAEVRHS